MAKRILFLHGRSFKPTEASLSELWLLATRAGIERSHPDQLDLFDAADKRLVYFGDLSNEFLLSKGRSYDLEEDLIDRRAALTDLRRYQHHQFTKRQYKQVPGKSSVLEFFADVGAGPLHWLQLSERAISVVAPDLRHYWNPDSSFGSEVRWRFTVPLRSALDSGDRLLVIAHSLGTMIAWDTFWKFSYTGEYREYRDRRVDLWITIGSPLADETVRSNLKGARATGPRRFPTNVRRWENLAAADDYIAHDQRVSNDFRAMRPITSIADTRLYNLAVRNGKSNPHHSCGYLIHPKLSRLVADWLNEPTSSG